MKSQLPISLEEEQNELLMSDAEIEDRIKVLFQELPSDRQAVVLDELHELIEDDGIEVEIIDEEEGFSYRVVTDQ